MNRIRYRAEFVLASEKGVLTAAMGKEATPERTSIAYPNPTAKSGKYSVRPIPRDLGDALYQWLAGFLTFGSSQHRAFSLSQWHFAACSPVHSDEIVQVLHLFPFYPLLRESAKQRHQSSLYSVLTDSRGFHAVSSLPMFLAASRISCIRRLHGPISQPASRTQRQVCTFSMARSKAASLIS